MMEKRNRNYRWEDCTSIENKQAFLSCSLQGKSEGKSLLLIVFCGKMDFFSLFRGN